MTRNMVISSSDQDQFAVIADRRQFAVVEKFRSDYGYEERLVGVPLAAANLVVSRVGHNVHMPALDLDYSASLSPTDGTQRLQLQLDKLVTVRSYRHVLNVLIDCGIITKEASHQALVSDLATGPGIGRDAIKPVINLECQAYLVASSTAGHYHLYLNQAISWRWYLKLLRALAHCGLIEDRFYTQAKIRHYTCLRLPWIHKEP